ncbi:DUF1289 domain-containing protein [Daeguia caeni]|uniref:DUF1289 domain-containing protein n=1 Tax=Daeguia caeni TaxID=439612 RepID=A0ABV9H533_9HYPH
MIESPCINVCSIKPPYDWCRGCARTIDEIARWASLSDQERQAVLQRLPDRKTLMEQTFNLRGGM